MAPDRIPLQYPKELSTEQSEFYRYLDSSFAGTWGKIFKIKDEGDRFIGPFGVTLATPSIGKPFYDLVQALGAFSPLSAVVRETAILTVTAHFKTEYATYAHELLALQAGMQREHIDALNQGREPPGATPEIKLAFEMASALVRSPRALSQDLWESAVESFGKEGAIALVHFISLYSYTCVMLNAFDVKTVSELAAKN